MLRRRLSAALSVTLLTPLLAVPLGGTLALVGASPASAAPASSVAVNWQRIALRTVYAEGATAPPVGPLYLAFTSLAVHDAAKEGQRHGRVAASAAVAVAAHDVLSEYFASNPVSKANLDADLASTLAALPDGPKESKGAAIGAASADEMIASRIGDGRNDPTIVYNKPPAIGTWQPLPGQVMTAAWLGFVRPVAELGRVPVDGPDALSSAAWARDYNEVRRLGNVGSTERTAEQEAIARFFSGNPITMFGDALCRHLDADPLGLRPTTRLFARIHAAQSSTFIETWRLKFDIGFWRPYEATVGADQDGNPATTSQSGWVPLIPNPSYSEYTTGHGAGTSSFAGVLRRTLGDDTPLLLRNGPVERSYATLSALEHDALHARIWGGLHFRDAMEDGYAMGHQYAGRAMATVR